MDSPSVQAQMMTTTGLLMLLAQQVPQPLANVAPCPSATVVGQGSAPEALTGTANNPIVTQATRRASFYQ
jgi:hypothetical protein